MFSHSLRTLIGGRWHIKHCEVLDEFLQPCCSSTDAHHPSLETNTSLYNLTMQPFKHIPITSIVLALAAFVMNVDAIPAPNPGQDYSTFLVPVL